jgi:hypothetical protein
MKSIIIASVLFASGVWAADEVADRTAIESMIKAFSLMPGHDALYTSDFDRDELVRFGKAPAAVEGDGIPITIDGVPGTVVISKEPMGEAEWFPPGMPGRPTVLAITIKKIRFVTADVAMVDVVRNGPALIVMKRVGTDWKIASMRRLEN